MANMTSPYRIQQAKEFDDPDALLEALDALLDEILEPEKDESRRGRLKRTFAGLLVLFGRRCADEGWLGRR